jgi:hypothetical protein
MWQARPGTLVANMVRGTLEKKKRKKRKGKK